MNKVILIFVVILTQLKYAKADIISFDDLVTTANTTEIGNYYRFGDYQLLSNQNESFSAPGFHIYGTNDVNWTGSSGLTLFNVGGQIELTTVSGSLFDLNFIDISRGDQNTSFIPVSFIGNKVNSASVVQTYFFSDSSMGTSERFFFNDKFKGLQSLVWYQGAEWHQFDNISLSKVSEPSTFILFASLLLLAIRSKNYFN